MTVRIALIALGALAIGSPLSGATAPTVVDVTAGKPSEFAFKLSKAIGIPSGIVVFHVTNRGAVPHGLKVCAAPVRVRAAKANACAGPATRTIKPGGTATLTVTLPRAGLYEYLSSIAGQPAKGMKGLLGVKVVTAPPAPAPGPTITTTAPPVPTGTTASPAPTSTDTGAGSQLFVNLGCSSCHSAAEVRAMGVPITSALNTSHPLQFPNGPLTASQISALAAYLSGSER